VAWESKVVAGDEMYDLKFGSGEERYGLEVGSGDETKERGVGSGDDMNDPGLSSGWSSFLVELIVALFAVDGVRACDFLEDQGRGIVMVKLCL
jgi:hypothetical protein